MRPVSPIVARAAPLALAAGAAADTVFATEGDYPPWNETVDGRLDAAICRLTGDGTIGDPVGRMVRRRPVGAGRRNGERTPWGKPIVPGRNIAAWRRLPPLLALAVALAVGPAFAQEPPVRIGALYNLSGAQQDLDRPSSEGARLAVDEVNAAGGLLGRQVEMVLLDGRTDPQRIAAQARDLIRDMPDLAGMIGFSDTDMVLAAAPMAAARGRVFITSGATSPILPRQIPNFLYLACFGDNVQAAAGAEWAYHTLTARTAVVLYRDGSSYTRLLHDYFVTRFTGLRGRILAEHAYGPADLAARLKTLPTADLVYLAALPDDVTATIPLIRAAGITAPILGGDGLDIGAAWAAVEAVRDVYYTTHVYVGADNPDPAVQKFRAAFAAADPGREPDAFTALGYDAARLLLAAIAAAGTADPVAVRRAVARTHDFPGVTGRISFSAGSQIPSKPVTIMGVDGSGPHFVTTVLPARVPPP